MPTLLRRVQEWLEEPVPVLRIEIVRIGAPLAILGFMSTRIAHADEWIGDAGFRVPDLDAFKKHVDKLNRSNPQLAPRTIDFNDEGKARLALFQRCPHGEFHLADPDGTLIDVAEYH